MMPLKFALCLTCLALGSVAQKTNLKSSVYVRQESGFVSPSVGDKVTLQCFYEEDAVMFYWYKQSLGQNPKLVSKFYKHEKNGTFYSEFENNSRFSLDTGNGNNHLIISDLQISDSATYYCIGIYVYDFEFSEGVTVSVEGSGINIQTLLHQSETMVPSETIEPGGSALNCIIHKHTYDGGHRVYWFQDSVESHPGLIYANGVRSDEYEKRPTTQTHTCFYNLPMKSPNLSDALSYCAVASCGHILFGDREELHIEHEHSVVLVYFLSGALIFTIILLLMLSYAALRINIKMKRQSSDSQARSANASTPNTEGNQDSDNLHYAALRDHKVNRSKRQRDNTNTECVYSSVKQ
ncbi:uncharacterized protein LOC113011930 [Astatotilapia calliptera]|uniref:Ig-like domain-containing protein n=1 Tax=Astatotilapia calliptera TaxID=8154 RepID=A0AAX7TV77_ASTCA|nr:uncharacterized protein LOC113011930 [Astatotilapia calliptera]